MTPGRSGETSPVPYKRLLLKMSGEILSGSSDWGIDQDVLIGMAERIRTVTARGVQLALVIGGGNIFRGAAATSAAGIQRATADQMGMLGTVINALAMQDALERIHVPTRVMTALSMESMAEPYIRRRAVRHLEKGRVVILSAGTGHPYFSTDTAAALRALEIGADILLKGTKVDGVYSSDPMIDKNAVRYDTLTFSEAIRNDLKIMDASAFTLCRDNNLPVVVFDLLATDNLERLVAGETVGTRITVS